tara:strand:- start:11589 stop:12524 length:936 start_codon:yes stop_codon:yes gene_type:complete
MITFLFFLFIVFSLTCLLFWIWVKNDRSYSSNKSVSEAYDNWTNDLLLERLWGEHIHLGYYQNTSKKTDFRKAKIDFVHQLVHWSGLDKLPKGSRVLDVGCGIGGSSRILARDYGFDVLGISISSEQVSRARQLTQKETTCRFEVMDALEMQLEKGSFDGIWSVEAGPHMPDKQLYADEMLKVLRPGGVLAVADWNRRDPQDGAFSRLEEFVLRQLLNQWSHPEFSSIQSFRSNLYNSPFSGGIVETEDWTKFTLPSWHDSIIEGFRRPGSILTLGGLSLFKAIREIPTILLMRWAFKNGLMQFGVFKMRG